MPERPHPNLDRVRDALREADEREDTEPDHPAPAADDAGDRDTGSGGDAEDE
jgi:hypothetical protein